MDLFVLDRDPRIAAQLHCDRDVLNKIIQCSQILAAVYLRYDELSFNSSKGEWQTKNGRKTYAPYDGIGDNPIVRWTGDTYGNYSYVRRMMHGFLMEYQRRYAESAKRHKSWEVYESLREPPRLLRAAFLEQRERMTAFLMPDGDKLSPDCDVVTLHRKLYASRKNDGIYRMGNTPQFMLEQDFL